MAGMTDYNFTRSYTDPPLLSKPPWIDMNSSETNETLFSVEREKTFAQFLYAYGIPVTCIFGILGNILSFKVFVFTSFGKQSSSTYIAALSLSDTGFLSSLFFSWMGSGRIGIHYGRSPIWCHFMIYVTYVCSFLSVWYVVLIMLDRYIVVCHSLHVQWCSRRRSRIYTALVTVFGMLLYSYTFFAAEIKGDNCTVHYKSYMMRLLTIVTYIDTAITFVIPFVSIISLNVIVIASIRRFQMRHVERRERKVPAQNSQHIVNALSKAQVRITRTFITVSVVLLFTNVPSHGIRFYIIVKQLLSEVDPDPIMIQVQQICQFIYYTNFATNFLIYSVSSKLFRKYLSFKYCCSYCYRRQQHRARGHLYR